jgi:hypothetical protein
MCVRSSCLFMAPGSSEQRCLAVVAYYRRAHVPLRVFRLEQRKRVWRLESCLTSRPCSPSAGWLDPARLRLEVAVKDAQLRFA